MKSATILVLLATVLAGCQNTSSKTSSEPTGELVARFGDLEITTADVDARILALPASERPKPGQDLDVWYEEQIRELAVEHQLRAEAEADKLDEDAAFLATRREIEKLFAVQLCLADLRPELEHITDDDLRAAYEERTASFAAPERRAAFHLFLRQSPGTSPDTTRAKIEALRDQVLGGESFQRVAAANSDSESRHRSGSIGWVVPGQLPEGFEKVIFSLEEGVPSEPVRTRDGFHLFYVEQILPARQLTLEEIKDPLKTRLIAERRDAALREIEAEIEPPEDALILDHPAFAAFAEAGDPDAVLLRVGDVELTLSELFRQVRQARAQQKADQRIPPGQLAWQQLEHLRRRELIYLQCRADDKIPTDELEARLARWQDQALLNMQRQRRLIALAERDAGRLQLFYDNNIGNFSKPPTWHLRRLSIPFIAADARQVMARLEAAAATGEGDLATLQAELGGEIEDLEPKTLAELHQIAPKLPPLVAPLRAGALSPPYRALDTLDIVEVVAWQDAEPLPFVEVRQRLATAYVEQYTQEVYDELRDEILQTAELQILPEGLTALREAGLPQADVSVEQLEELLDSL